MIRRFGVSAIAAAALASHLILAADAPAAKDAKPKPYPLKTCIVSDEKLGEMGDPFVFVKDGQEFKLCCKNCKKDIEKDPKKFFKKLADEVKKQKDAKPQ
jgi:hypothetical protein